MTETISPEAQIKLIEEQKRNYISKSLKDREYLRARVEIQKLQTELAKLRCEEIEAFAKIASLTRRPDAKKDNTSVQGNSDGSKAGLDTLPADGS